MKTVVIIITLLNLAFFVLHEINAIAKGEWKMFAFLRGFKEQTQKLIFIYAHLLLPSLLVIYMYAVFEWNMYGWFIGVNVFSVAHLILHLFARKWKSNVFKDKLSLFFINGMGITGLINLVMYPLL